MNRVFVLPYIFHSSFRSKTNTITRAKGLYQYKNDYFVFLSHKSIKAITPNTRFKKVEKSSFNYTLQAQENFARNLEFIMALPGKEFYFIGTIDIHEHILISELFFNYLGVSSFNFINSQTFLFSPALLKEPSFVHETTTLAIETMVIMRVLNEQTFSFFFSNTTMPDRVDWLHLMLDQQLRQKKGKGLVVSNHERSVYLAPSYHSSAFHLKNVHLFISMLEDGFYIGDTASYKEFTLYDIAVGENHYWGDYIEGEKRSAKPTLLENIPPLMDYYSLDEIYYKISQVYEDVSENELEELTFYEPINISFDVWEYTKFLLSNIGDKNSLAENINDLQLIFRDRYQEKSSPVASCPFCLSGEIYKSHGKFFCFHCSFFLHTEKIREKYGFLLTKRLFKTLLKKRSIVMPYNGENRTFYLKPLERGDDVFYFLSCLKKGAS